MRRNNATLRTHFDPILSFSIQQNAWDCSPFGLKEFADFFIVSCFVHCRKPEPEMYRLALNIAQVEPGEVVYIDDQVLFVEVAQSLGIHSVHHTGYDSTRAALAALGLALAT